MYYELISMKFYYLQKNKINVEKIANKGIRG